MQLLRQYVDRKTGKEVMLFDVFLFSDTMVVYVANPDGSVVDRFLMSAWDSVDISGVRGRNYRIACKT